MTWSVTTLRPPPPLDGMIVQHRIPTIKLLVRPNIKLYILLIDFHIFLMVPVGKICITVKKVYLGDHCLPFMT